jgi:hypothetical protein
MIAKIEIMSPENPPTYPIILITLYDVLVCSIFYFPSFINQYNEKPSLGV